MQNKFTLLIFILLSSAISACTHHTGSSMSIDKTPESSINNDQSQGWYFVRFYPDWPESEERARFYLDTMIADRVIAPVLYKYRDQISLWRFHRRASRRNGGKHRFSFLFYSDTQTAQSVIRAIESSKELKKLSELEILEQYTLDKTFPSTLDKIHMTSDGNWPMEIQRSWPYYIMGVSEMWLDLIQQLKPVGAISLNRENLEAQYKALDSEITELWQEYGQHAYLHHLSALYGYEPMKLREQRWIRF